MKIKNALRTATAMALALATAALLAGHEHADAQGLSLGFDAGISMATFSGENIAELDHKAGLAAGVSMAWRVDDFLSLETVASWIRKGASGLIPGSITGFDESLLMNLNLDYLQFPALARFHLPSVGMLRPTLFAGPAVAFEIACEVQTAPEEIALTLGCGAADAGRSKIDLS